MPFGGWTCDELAGVFRYKHASKATQSFNPAVLKVARAMRANPTKTLRALSEAVDLIEANERLSIEEIMLRAPRPRRTNGKQK